MFNHYCVITVSGNDIEGAATFPKPEFFTDKHRKIALAQIERLKKEHPDKTVKMVERKERDVKL